MLIHDAEKAEATFGTAEYDLFEKNLSQDELIFKNHRSNLRAYEDKSFAGRVEWHEVPNKKVNANDIIKPVVCGE